jgi:hypothetical protein
VWDLATGDELQKFDGLDEFATVVFEANDTQIYVFKETENHGRYAHLLKLSPTLTMSTQERRNFICDTSLLGAQAFRSDEMNDVILRDRDDLRDPCRRRGPISLSYYAQIAENWWRWAKSAMRCLN